MSPPRNIQGHRVLVAFVANRHLVLSIPGILFDDALTNRMVRLTKAVAEAEDFDLLVCLVEIDSPTANHENIVVPALF